MKNHVYMDYSSPQTITESGAKAFRLGISKDECPVDPRTNANGVCWWRNGWESESKKKCKGPKCSAKRGIGHSDECIKEHNSHYEKDLPPEIFPGTKEALDKFTDLSKERKTLEEMTKENEQLNKKIRLSSISYNKKLEVLEAKIKEALRVAEYPPQDKEIINILS